MDAVSAGYRNIDEDTQTVSEKIIVSGIIFAAGRTAHRPVGHQRRRQVDLHQDHRRRAAIAGGRHQFNKGLSIGYFAQHQVEMLRHDESPLWHMTARAQCARAGAAQLPGQFHFNGAMATSPITPFSGGEKARLALALIVWQRPNLLLLDEPTNHLDLETREALTSALAQFEGTLVLVSHDRHLLRASTDQFIIVADGQCVLSTATWTTTRPGCTRPSCPPRRPEATPPGGGAGLIRVWLGSDDIRRAGPIRLQSRPLRAPPALPSRPALRDAAISRRCPSKTSYFASQYLAPHHLVSRLFGYASDCREPAVKNWMISRFVQRYGVDMSEAEQEDALAYDCFNDFFTRALKDGARPLDDEPGSVLCPADGAISQMGAIEHGRIFQAKGHSYGLADLLGGDAERAAFQGGEFATIYLSPRDYHRSTCRWPARCAKWSTCRAGCSRQPADGPQRAAPVRAQRARGLHLRHRARPHGAGAGRRHDRRLHRNRLGRPGHAASAASRPRATTPTRARPSTWTRAPRWAASSSGPPPSCCSVRTRSAGPTRLGARPGPHGRAAGPAGLRPPARSGGQP